MLAARGEPALVGRGVGKELVMGERVEEGEVGRSMTANNIRDYNRTA